MVGGRNFESTPAHGTWRVEPNRMMQWETTVDGQKLIADGKLLGNGVQLPWANRCGN
jgi:hypothetical protein